MEEIFVDHDWVQVKAVPRYGHMRIHFIEFFGKHRVKLSVVSLGHSCLQRSVKLAPGDSHCICSPAAEHGKQSWVFRNSHFHALQVSHALNRLLRIDVAKSCPIGPSQNPQTSLFEKDIGKLIPDRSCHYFPRGHVVTKDIRDLSNTDLGRKRHHDRGIGTHHLDRTSLGRFDHRARVPKGPTRIQIKLKFAL